ncbi:uncharacterized protein LOC125754439 isoform X4 [Canis lupus dingo]|uniref:uncharacterized protein LOC125754439 isoform X4 n=1 Tax=Canis lupus dingo TaxID=286419 RepID=UPI0020C3243E|nr:uncharacterized protein LOC125754439 isoform X4 [Canis lupus dingo]
MLAPVLKALGTQRQGNTETTQIVERVPWKKHLQALILENSELGFGDLELLLVQQLFVYSVRIPARSQLVMLRKKQDDTGPGRVMGHDPTRAPGEAGQSLLLSSPVCVLCGWTGTLRTIGRRKRKPLIQGNGTHPVRGDLEKPGPAECGRSH